LVDENAFQFSRAGHRAAAHQGDAMAMTLDDIDLADLDAFVGSVPHDMFDVLRNEAPVWYHPAAHGVEGFWCIVKHHDVQELSRDYQHASSARGGITLHDMGEAELEMQRQMMLQMDPPNHTKLRLLVNKGFTPRMIGRLDEHIREIARSIVDEIAARGECDFVVDVAAELPLQVIAEMMGVPHEDRHKIFDWSNRMIGSEDPEYSVTREDAIGAGTEMFFYSTELAAAKRANPGDDIISALLQAEVDGEMLTDTEFNLFFQLLAVAGNETTRNLISHGMHLLIQHPDQYAALVADRSLLPGAVDEMLRYASPVMYMRRTAQSDFELRGQTIREGDKIALWYIAANRDEEVFDQPHTFDITRSPNEHVAFGGGGPHFCLGANLAKLEIRVMFEELLDRLPDIGPAGPVERLRSNFINGIKHMPVRFTPAN
jgi:cholest-4-en-3-one 26-monooxygenase